MIKISIIIPSLGLTDNIFSLLESINQQSLNHAEYEIFFIFNGLQAVNSNTELFAKKCKDYEVAIHINYVTNKGVNRARNFGLNNSNGVVLLFLDDDCILDDKYFLSKHIDFHFSNKEIFAFGGGYTLTNNASFFDKAYNNMQMLWLYSGVSSAYLKYHKTKHLIGGNFSIKKEFVKNKELQFDENIIYGGSEYEFFINSVIKKHSLVLNSLNVLHKTNESIISVTKKIFKQGSGQALINSRYAAQVLIKNNENIYVNNRQSYLQNFFRIYFNYVYWFGYYYQKKSVAFVFKLICKDVMGYVNLKRFALLDLINKNIEKIKRDAQ